MTSPCSVTRSHPPARGLRADRLRVGPPHGSASTVKGQFQLMGLTDLSDRFLRLIQGPGSRQTPCVLCESNSQSSLPADVGRPPGRFPPSFSMTAAQPVRSSRVSKSGTTRRGRAIPQLLKPKHRQYIRCDQALKSHTPRTPNAAHSQSSGSLRSLRHLGSAPSSENGPVSESARRFWRCRNALLLRPLQSPSPRKEQT